MCIINITTDANKLAENLEVARRNVVARGVFLMDARGNVIHSKEKFNERTVEIPKKIKWGVIHHRHATSGTARNEHNNHPWHIAGTQRTVVGCQYGAVLYYEQVAREFGFVTQGNCDSEVGLQLVANLTNPTSILNDLVIGTLVMWHYERERLIMYNNCMNRIGSDFITTMNVPGHRDQINGWHQVDTRTLDITKIHLNKS